MKRTLISGMACVFALCAAASGVSSGITLADGWLEDAVHSELLLRTLPKKAKKSSYDAVFKEVCDADRACDEAWLRCKTKEEFFARGRKVREDFIEALGGFPKRKCPLNPKIAGMVRRDGYTVEKVVFESWPGVHVPANLYLPDDTRFKPPYPAVLLPCGHSKNGKGAALYQRGCVLAAKSGMACLIFDPYDQGERMQGRRRNVHAHNYAGALAALLGAGMARYRIWDAMRALDYLETRPEIDAARMGVMGNSGGGTMTSLMMAVDMRIKAACPSCYISTYPASAHNVGPGDAEQNTFGQFSIGVNNASFAFMQSPMPIRFMFCHGDFFPFKGSLETYSLVSEIAKRFGFDDRCGMTDVDGKHGWKESTITSSVEWMRRWLYGDVNAFKHDLEGYRRLDSAFDAAKSDMGLSERECLCCPDGKVLNIPGERTIYDLIRDEYADALKARKGRVDACDVRRIAGIREPGEDRVVRREISCKTLSGNLKVMRNSYTWPNGVVLPVVLFVPSNPVNGASPLLVTGDEQKMGRKAKAICAALREGRAAATVDLMGRGEVDGFRRRFYGANENEEGMAVLLYTLGRSIVGMQAGELLEVADDLRRMYGAPVELSAFGRVCIASAHAHYVRPDLIASLTIANAPSSWDKAVRNSGRVPFCNVVNGALRLYDWTDLLPKAVKRPADDAIVTPKAETGSKDRMPSAMESWPDGSPVDAWFHDMSPVDEVKLGRLHRADKFGLKPDVPDLQTESLQRAIDSIASEGGGVLVLGAGVWNTSSLFFKPGVHLKLEKGAVLKGPADGSAVPKCLTRMVGLSFVYAAALVNADRCNGFTVYGEGMIDGNGKSTWSEFWKRRGKEKGFTDWTMSRPRNVYVSNSKNVRISGVKIRDSHFWTTHFHKCERVKIDHVRILAPGRNAPPPAPSSDAIDLDAVKDVHVWCSYMDVNDDALSLKGGKNYGCEKLPENGGNFNVLVEDCVFGPVCHHALTLGSEAFHCRNVVMRNSEVKGCGALLNLKSRPDTKQLYEHILVENVRGRCRAFFRMHPWRQYFTLPDGVGKQETRALNVKFRNCSVNGREDIKLDPSFMKLEGYEPPSGVL